LFSIVFNKPLFLRLTVIANQEKYQNRQIETTKYDEDRFTNVFPFFFF
jgi:hypothetical protein